MFTNKLYCTKENINILGSVVGDSNESNGLYLYIGIGVGVVVFIIIVIVIVVVICKR